MEYHMSPLEIKILKSIYQKNTNSESDEFEIESLTPLKVTLNVRSGVEFNYLTKSDDGSYTFPKDESVNQLIMNLTMTERSEYNKLQSTLDPIRLKAAIGLAFVH